MENSGVESRTCAIRFAIYEIWSMEKKMGGNDVIIEILLEVGIYRTAEMENSAGISGDS